jgi:hypothetical protein
VPGRWDPSTSTFDPEKRVTTTVTETITDSGNVITETVTSGGVTVTVTQIVGRGRGRAEHGWERWNW